MWCQYFFVQCWRTIMFGILQASFQGHQPSGLAVHSLRVVFRDSSLIILVCLVHIYGSGFGFFLSHLLPFSPSTIFTSRDRHMLLVYDTYTSGVKREPFIGWVNTSRLPTLSPHNKAKTCRQAALTLFSTLSQPTRAPVLSRWHLPPM